MSPFSFRESSLLLLLLGALTLTSGSRATAEENPAAGARPNVIFVLTDDLGYGDVGVFYQNARHARGEPCELTPQLDAMAAQGIQLRDHYSAAPVCAPARGSLLAGVHQGHAGVRNNQFDKALEDNHTLASTLRTAGYATAAIGKWGLQGELDAPVNNEGPGKPHWKGSPETWPAYPTKRGFDYFFGYVRHIDGHEHYPKEGIYGGPMPVWDQDREISATLAGCYTADLFTARAKKWIIDQHAAASGKPFFLYLAYDTPHAALEYPTKAYPTGGGLRGGLQWLGEPGKMINTTGQPDSWCHPDFAGATFTGAQGQKRPWPEVCKRYATSVRRIDDCVGDLLQLLRDLKIDDNTLVIFTSDNGPSDESYLPKNQPMMPPFFRSFGPFDGIKRDCWEGGMREPTLVRWPGKIPAGAISTTPSQFQDWMPTLTEVAGLPAPARTDGVSLLPTLTGRSGQKPSLIYSEYFHNGKTPGYKDFAPAHRNRPRQQMQLLRLGDFMGVRYNVKSTGDDFEIYDVAHDPEEATNLAATKPEMERQMKETVLQVRRPDASAPRPYDAEWVPPNAPFSTVPGIVWQTAEGDFPWLPKVEFLPISASGTGAIPDVALLPPGKKAAIMFTGYLDVPEDGSVTFSLAVVGKALLRIHEATVIDEDFHYEGGARTGEIKLKAGLHAFRLTYLPEATGTRKIDFQWSRNGGSLQAIPAEVFRRAKE